MKSYIEATREVLVEELSADDSVVIFGRDVGPAGGFSRSTSGLVDVFGPERVRSFPPGEHALVGAAIGAALAGLRPIVDLIAVQDVAAAVSHLSQATQVEALSSGQISVPLTLRVMTGYGLATGGDQAGDLHPLWAGTPGLEVLATSGARSAKSLLKAAIRSPRPTVILEDRSLFEVREELGDDEAGNATGEVVEIGKCQRVLKGDKGTIVAWGPSVRLVSEALGILKDQHLQLDLFDLQSLAPLDFEPIAKSCVRSGRLFVVEPCTATCSIGGELAARIMESCFDYLDAPVGRLNVDERIGYSPTLESSSIPQASDVADAIRRWLDA